MDLCLWLMVLYFIIGIVAYFSSVKNIKRKIVFIKADTGSQDRSKNTKFVVWWIVGLTIWGCIGIVLILLWFL